MSKVHNGWSDMEARTLTKVAMHTGEKQNMQYSATVGSIYSWGESEWFGPGVELVG
jgi:hypothetical protein